MICFARARDWANNVVIRWESRAFCYLSRAYRSSFPSHQLVAFLYDWPGGYALNMTGYFIRWDTPRLYKSDCSSCVWTASCRVSSPVLVATHIHKLAIYVWIMRMDRWSPSLSLLQTIKKHFNVYICVFHSSATPIQTNCSDDIGMVMLWDAHLNSALVRRWAAPITPDLFFDLCECVIPMSHQTLQHCNQVPIHTIWDKAGGYAV